MTRIAIIIMILSTAAPAWAYDCLFHRSCFEQEACADADFLVQVDLEAQILSTDFGDITIVAVKTRETLSTLFATGAGAEYLMSVTPDAARLSIHMNQGPLSVSYLGQCEGLF